MSDRNILYLSSVFSDLIYSSSYLVPAAWTVLFPSSNVIGNLMRKTRRLLTVVNIIKDNKSVIYLNIADVCVKYVQK